MTLPSVTMNRVDGKLNTVTAAPSKALVIGPCSGGTKETRYTFSQTNNIISSIGYGPAQVCASIVLADNGGSVDVMVASGSIAGYTSTVTSSSIALITVSGTPYDTFDVSGRVKKTGTLDSAKFDFSLDGAETFSPEVIIAGTYVLPNTGLTMTFASGTYTAGQTFSFKTYAPSMNAPDLAACISAFTASSVTPSLIVLANDVQSAVSGSALANAMNSHLTSLQSKDIVTLALCPAGGVDAGYAATIAAVNAGVVVTPGNVLAVAAERCRMALPSPFMGYANPRVPFVYSVASRVQGKKISTNPARFIDGGLARCTDASYDENMNGEIYLPENIIAPRTFTGMGGVYVNQGFLKSAVGSDYKYVQWGRVINRADQICRSALRKYINKSVRTLTDGSGFIDPRDKANIESDVNSQLNTAIMQELNDDGFLGHASGVLFSVLGNTNVLASSEIQSTCVIVPLANVSNVTVTLGFTTSIATAASPATPVATPV